MTAPDFSAMTRAELRAYVVAHPNDPMGFHAFVDRFTAEASPEIYDLPKSEADLEVVKQLIQQKLIQPPSISDS